MLTQTDLNPRTRLFLPVVYKCSYASSKPALPRVCSAICVKTPPISATVSPGMAAPDFTSPQAEAVDDDGDVLDVAAVDDVIDALVRNIVGKVSRVHHAMARRAI